EETPKMKHNVFSDDYEEENVLSHAEMEEIATDARRIGSMKEAFLQHGINQIDYLFPDAKNVGPAEPIFVQRDMAWVNAVMNGVKHSPFSRIKSMFANITGEEARARGYIKGNRKEEEVFALLKRTTTPKTVYKKQAFDRDDVIDITDLDIVAWVKKEMRMMLDEEIARAILVGDGRSSISPDKIDEDKVRPIYLDDDFFTVKYPVVVSAGATAAAKAKAFIQASIRSRKEYKGSGNPVMFMTEDMLTECLLLEDLNQRIIYDTEEKLRTALRVSKIVTVPVFEGLTASRNGKSMELAGIYVNLSDYNVGADKGGSVNLFDDFDIDFNQYKYLIETRISGALIKPFSAVVLEFGTAAPLTLGVAPSGRDETVIGETVRDMQNHVTVFGDKVAGTLNYLAEVEDVHDAGNFLALNVVIPSDASATAQLTGGSAASISSGNNAFAITSSTKTLTIVVTRSSESMTKVFDLTGLNLKSA
ncbi:MAG: phage major capsid protein, partial [Lachnospiraceae bacterium]|nr:phage major capsid protein [Lachnospiraceae bacterium]